MEVIIKGRRVQTEKETCLNGINESISETLATGTPDIRRVVASLDKLGQYLISDEELSDEYILPKAFDPRVRDAVADAVAKAARATGVARI